MNKTVRDYRTGSLKGLKAVVEETDYERLFPKERYIGKEWLQKEYDLLWPRVWQWVCREEEIPNIGDFYEYRIGDQSFLIVREKEDKLNVFYNTCMHRGTRLVEGKHKYGGPGTFNGNKAQFDGKITCVFHGWAYDLDGELCHLPGAKDFAKGMVKREEVCLRRALIDTWEGFIFINMDLKAEPLLDYLNPAPKNLRPYNIGEMRIQRHYTTILPCNWKYAIDQFQEGYHVWATHVMDLNNVGAVSTGPGGRRVGEKKGGSYPPPDKVGAMTVYEQFDLHTNFWEPHWQLTTGLPPGVKLGDLSDDDYPTPREWVRKAIEIMVIQNRAAQYELDYFDELKDLPLDMIGPDFMVKLRRDACAARSIDLSHLENQQMFGFPCEHRIFPNMLGPAAGNSFGLFRARPNGDDPDSMIWDIYFMFRYGDGEVPPIHYEFIPDWRSYPDDRMPPSFMQDFKTTPLFQKGMHSKAFPGHRYCRQEQNVIHTQKLLDQIIGLE